MGYVSDGPVKPRKRHQCRVCGELIEIGEQCHTYRGVEDNEGFYTLYFHDDCWRYSRDWDWQDWETFYPGAISRKEVQEGLSGERKQTDV